MTEIKIKIDCKKETCYLCKAWVWSEILNKRLCILFQKSVVGIIKELDFERLPECIQAEKEAAGEV